MQEQPQFDARALAEALAEQIRQPANPKIPKEPTWAERKLGMPKSLEEIVWRLCWLAVVPAIGTIAGLPILIWLYHNYYPWLSLLIMGAVGFSYYLFYLFNSGSGRNKEARRLIDVQLAIPPCVVAFLLFHRLLTLYG